jgi:hypothetical protein
MSWSTVIWCVVGANAIVALAWSPRRRGWLWLGLDFYLMTISMYMLARSL